MDASTNPLTSPPPPEIPLRDSPLVIALAQVRFPTILSVNNPTHIAGFQESIRGDFPDYSQEGAMGVQTTAEGVQIVVPSSMHRFRNEAGWTASLCQDFLAVHTTDYQNRDDFIGRFKSVVESLHKNLNPSRVNRLGVRFVDRIGSEDELQGIAAFVNPEFLGPEVFRRAPKPPPQIMSRQLLSAREGEVIAQWGFRSPNEKLPPGFDAVDALPGPSWILDLDMHTPEQMEGFNPDAVSKKTGEFVDRIYAIFRHVFLSEFIRKRGGSVRL